MNRHEDRLEDLLYWKDVLDEDVSISQETGNLSVTVEEIEAFQSFFRNLDPTFGSSFSPEEIIAAYNKAIKGGVKI